MIEDSINGNPAHNGAAASAHTEIEKALIQIWSEVLNTNQITIHDDFLGLGGDSLAAMRCMNRIISTCGVEVPLELFLLESANVAQVAAEIARIQSNAGPIAASASA